MKNLNCRFCGATEHPVNHFDFCCDAAMGATQKKSRLEDLRRGTCPLCDNPSENGETHSACHDEEKYISEHSLEKFRRSNQKP